MKIDTMEQLEEILLKEYGAIISCVEEINKFEHYSLIGDKEHDYSLLKRVYKFINKENDVNPYEEVFILVFSKDGGIYEIKGIGESPCELEKVWGDINWEND